MVDGTDNFPTRYLVNDACVLLKQAERLRLDLPLRRSGDRVRVRGGPCYRCLYPEPPPPGLVPSCAEGGVLGILPGMIGLIQATETVKLILASGEPLVGRLLLYDALGDALPRTEAPQEIRNAPSAATIRPITKLIDYQQFCGVAAAAGACCRRRRCRHRTRQKLKQKIDRGETFVLIDVRETHEYQICNIPDAKLIPLGDLPKRVGELITSDEIVAHCKSGMRSAEGGRFPEAGRVPNVSAT